LAQEVIELLTTALAPMPTNLCPGLGQTATVPTGRRGKIKAPASGTNPDWSHVLITIKPY